MLVVITNCETIKPGHKLHKETTDLFQEMILKNNNLKLILITEDIGQTNAEWHCNIEIKPVSRLTKFKLFKIMMESEKKMALLKGIKKVEDHVIFEKVGIQKISKIVSQLSNQVTLDHILQELK